MKPKPVKRNRKPGYPTRLEVLSDPELLRRNLPPAWRSVPGMAGSIALFLAANSVVRGADEKPPVPSTAAIVAPIFDHGEGRGATGCVVIAPPVFLSEEEAWQVIDEELAKRNVKVPDKNVALKGVKIPQRFRTIILKGGKGEWRTEEAGSSAKPFAADRENPEQRIAIEFISERDYFSKAGAPSDLSTVRSYDFRETAKDLAENVRKQAKEKVYFGVLYDPLAKTADLSTVKPHTQGAFIKAYLKAQQDGATESKRLLRLQVQDFINWLQAQGAI